MKHAAFDCETHIIQPGLLAPPLVCASFACVNPSDGSIQSVLLDKSQARSVFRDILTSDVTVVGANIAYDMLVMAVDSDTDLMPLIFAKYERGEVFDVRIAEMLHAISRGHLGKDPRTGGDLVSPVTGKRTHYSLEMITDLVLFRSDAKKNDYWRLRYALLEDQPFDSWPAEAIQYPKDDAANTLEDALAQLGLRPRMDMHQWSAKQTCTRCGVEIGSNIPRGCPIVQAAGNLHDQSTQVFASWCLHLGAAWGLRANGESVAALKAAAAAGQARTMQEFVKRGFLREDGSENGAVVKTACAIAYESDPFSVCKECTNGKIPGAGKNLKNCPTCNGTGLEIGPKVPRTEKGAIQISRDALTESGDEELIAYAVSQEDDKVIQTYIPFLEQAVANPITLRPNNPLETGRVSYQDPTQTFPRQVSAHLLAELKHMNAPIVGVRDCFEARPGYVYFSVDYTGGELVTFAEACVERVGYSKMGQALNQGIDVHSALAATMLGVSYETFIPMLKGEQGASAKVRAKLFRQAAKPENFGNPGGMGAVKKVLQQRKQGPDTVSPLGPSMVDDGTGNFVKGYKGLRFCILTGGTEPCGLVKIDEWKGRPCPRVCLACVEAAERGREAWFRQWPEARAYLQWHANNVNNNGYVVQLYSKRVRGNTDYSSEANGDFQALLADIAKRALIRVVTEQYADKNSPLFGSRTVLFAHDELFGECLAERGHEVCERIVTIMVEEFRKGCPHHAAACKAEPTLMKRWRKDAGPVYNDNGQLICWEPK